MNFKKRILTEEIGLTNDNRKTFTNGKKQKVVLNESQLQRLIRLINEKEDKKKGKSTTEPKKPFNVNKWSRPFIKKIDNFIRNKNFKGALNFLKGRLQTWKKKGSVAGPVWTKQLKQKSAVATKEKARVEREMKKKPEPRPNQATISSKPTKPTKPVKKPLNEQLVVFVCEPGSCACVPEFFGGGGATTYQSFQECQNDTNNCCGEEELFVEPMTDFSTDKPQTSPIRKKCCKCSGQPPYSLVPGKKCPKSCPEVNCKGTPPTQGNITTEDRDMGMNKEEGRYNTPENMKACIDAGGSKDECRQGLQTGTIPPAATGKRKSGFWCCLFNWKCCKGKPLEPIMRPFGESRILKTTNPITESEIKDMKKWFNRIDKSGKKYNPSRT